MDEQLAQRIVNDLAKHRSRNEIIRSVCEENGMNWRDVEQLVREVEQTHHRTIARRQSPLLILLSIGSLLIGLVLIFYSIEFFISFFQGDTIQQVLSLRSGYLRLVGALTGLGMTVGGLIGLWKTALPLLPE